MILMVVRPATHTVSFAFKGSTYEIDLGEENADTFTEVLEPWIAAACKTGGHASRRAAPPATSAR